MTKGSPTTKSMESFYLQDNPQYDDTESEEEDGEKKLIDDTIVVTHINGDVNDLVVDDEFIESNQLEDIFTESTINKTFTDTLTNIDVTLVTEKSNEIPYQSSAPSSASASSILVSSPLKEAPLRQTSSSLPDNSKTIDTSTVVVDPVIKVSNIEHSIVSTSIDTNIIINDTLTDTVNIPNPNTVTSIDLGSESRLCVETTSDIRYTDKLNDSDSEYPSPVMINSNKSGTTPDFEVLPEQEVITINDRKVKERKQDDVSDSDISDDEQSIPIPISFVSVSQVSGEIVATKGEPSVNLSAFSAELHADSIKNNKAVKFDQSIDKPSITSLTKSTDKSRDEIKWHLADQPKVYLCID